MTQCDLAIVGAGPAGMAVARAAAEVGLQVVVLDEQPRPGGQIYRDVTRAAQRRSQILGADYSDGLRLAEGLSHDNIAVVAGASVWDVDGSGVAYSGPDGTQKVQAARVLLATGAIERPMPVPGWTLPGVMTAGAAQIMMKQSAIAVRDAVLVGAGPLLYLVAVQLLRAGCAPRALVETQTRGDSLAALAHWRGAARGWRQLYQGLGMLAELRRAQVARFVGAQDVALIGEGKVAAVRFKQAGKQHELACGTVLLHHGVIPHTQAARAAGVAHHWREAQQAFVPQLDSWGRSPVTGLWIAGDSTGIGGAQVAALEGQIAALDIAFDLGVLTQTARDARAVPYRAQVRAQTAIRPFLDRAFPPYGAALLPADEVIVCRCEAVPAAEIRAAARAGCLGPNQTKAFTRAGMGRCQGRLCGVTVARLLADARGQSMDATGYVRVRPPLKPVTLGELAALHDPEHPLDQGGGHE